MAPAASTILSATSAAAAKRPAASDADLPLDSSALHQVSDVILPTDDEAAPKSQQQQLECPRCRSTNTKFCYYNNYSTAQPRHFCRACRRYWTHGGTLRDVPVGGASRRAGKRRRVSADEASSASPPDACLPDLPPSAFPFLSDGSFLPQFDIISGLAAPAPTFSSSSWQSSVVPDFYDGFAPWDDATVTVGSFTPAWGDIAGLDLTWAPPGNC